MPGSEKNSVAPGAVALAVKLVIICAGAIASPALLQRSRVPDPNQVIGRGLVLHPTLPIAGIFDGPLSNYRGITEAIYSDHYLASGGLYFESLFRHPVATAAALPGIGTEQFAIMSRYDKLAGCAAMLVDASDPRNRVIWDDARGAPTIIYRLSAQDKGRLRFGAQRGVEIMLAAGAKEAVLCTEEPLGSLPSARFSTRQDAALCERLEFRPCETTLLSSQCQSTMKMGEDPKRCAVNSRGESYASRNVIVCDASVFPTSCGASPMLAVMTLARYQGKRIANELARYGM
ncbi:MAG: GMC family oxidoreductase [Candidatus Eremiobacteraeota bacterium]|nr:GMC family oxidoreductase [Candidatus Eremiobacteraeota bacterium]